MDMGALEHPFLGIRVLFAAPPARQVREPVREFKPEVIFAAVHQGASDASGQFVLLLGLQVIVSRGWHGKCRNPRSYGTNVPA